MALIIAATLLPFGGMAAAQIPPRWCVRCGGLWMTDAISNVAMFVPFGVALALRRWTVWRVAVVSLLFTVGVEALQSVGVPPGRSPALADVMSNTVGGVLGALLVLGWRWQRVASRAPRCVVGFGGCARGCAVVGGWGDILTPVTGREAARATGTSITPSAFGHVPGHGWYEGLTDSAFVGSTRIKRGWSGPVIQQMSFEQFPVAAGVTVRGTDPLYGQIPLLFVHLPNDSAAWLQIAKHDTDVELTVLRRAWRRGLTMPSVYVPQAFADRTVNDARPLTVTANVTTAMLRLQTSGAYAGADSLALTPLLGWTLIQPIVIVQSPLAWLAHGCWLFALLAPIGWCVMCGARPLVVGAICTAVVFTAFVAIPIQMALGPLLVRDWTVSVLCLGCGSVLGWGYRARHVRRSAPPIA
ncbi:MAG: VanZ family protein [Gemmatimonas sp.]